MDCRLTTTTTCRRISRRSLIWLRAASVKTEWKCSVAWWSQVSRHPRRVQPSMSKRHSHIWLVFPKRLAVCSQITTGPSYNSPSNCKCSSFGAFRFWWTLLITTTTCASVRSSTSSATYSLPFIWPTLFYVGYIWLAPDRWPTLALMGFECEHIALLRMSFSLRHSFSTWRISLCG